MHAFDLIPSGPYDLTTANQYFGGWTSLTDDPATVVMCFPVEGWQASAAVVLRQGAAGAIQGEVYAPEGLAQAAWQQALATLSLDVDGAGWPAVGQRDPRIGLLQNSYHFLRPVLFHSPYEAAAAFIIGHRISIQQGRKIRQAMALESGDAVQVGNERFSAFPRPQVLRGLTEVKGLNPEKIERLHGIAEAALAGRLDRAGLRALPVEAALAQLQSLRGVGPFFAQGILYRGAGLADVVTEDETTQQAVQSAYGLAELPGQGEVLEIAETWRPYRMWATVLLHVRLRREEGGPRRKR